MGDEAWCHEVTDLKAGPLTFSTIKVLHMHKTINETVREI